MSDETNTQQTHPPGTVDALMVEIERALASANRAQRALASTDDSDGLYYVNRVQDRLKRVLCDYSHLKDRRPSSNAVWRKDFMTVEGWYWFRYTDGELKMSQVVIDDSGIPVMLTHKGGEHLANSKFLGVTWNGPITPPNTSEAKPLLWVTNYPKSRKDMWPRRAGVTYIEGPPKATELCTSDELSAQGLVGAYVDMDEAEYYRLPLAQTPSDVQTTAQNNNT